MVEKARKEFQEKLATTLADSMDNQARLDTEKIVFFKNIKEGKHLYIDPLVDTVKKTLKQKSTFQTKFNALMLLKEAMDTRNKEMANYVTTKILDRLKAIAKQSLKPDKNKLFNPPTQGDDFYLLLLECLYNWSIFFQLPADNKMQPSAFKTTVSQLQEAGVRFPTQFQYFQNIDLRKQEQEKPKQEQQKPQEQPKQQNQQQQKPLEKKKEKQSNPEGQVYQRAVENFTSLQGLLGIISESLTENNEVSFLFDMIPNLEEVIAPIQEITVDLQEEACQDKELLVSELLMLSYKASDIIKDMVACRNNKISQNVLKNKHVPSLKTFLESLKFDPRNVGASKSEEKPIKTFQEELIQEIKQPPQTQEFNFFFDQVANFDQEEIEKTKQEIAAQKAQSNVETKQPQQAQPIKQIQKEQPLPIQKEQPPPIQKEQPPQQSQQKQDEQTPKQQETPQPTWEPPAQFGFEQFNQGQATTQEFQTGWGVPQQLGDPQQFQADPRFDLPFDSKRVPTESDHQNGWEVKRAEEPPVNWGVTYNENQWQNEKQNTQSIEEVVVELKKPTLPQLEIKKPKRKPNPFERQSSVNSQDENQTPMTNGVKKLSEDAFQNFSKVMDNKSEYKTDADGPPFSNVFGFGDDLGDLNLENMAASAKMSKQDRSKSFESEQGQAKQFENQFEIIQKRNSNNWDTTNNQFQWGVETKQEEKLQNFDAAPQEDQLFDPYGNKENNDQNTIAQRPKFNFDDNLSKENAKSDFYGSPDPFKNQGFQFDLVNLPKHSMHPLNTRQLNFDSKVIDIEIYTISTTNRKQLQSRKADAEVQACEQQTTLLKFNPQQEIEHQQEKQILLKELEQLRYLKSENGQDLKEQKQLIENYQQQFKLFKQQEQRMTQAYKQLDKQFNNLNEYYKQLKSDSEKIIEELKQIQLENVQLNELYTQSIKDLSDSKSNEESLQNKLRIIERQFQQIKFNHKCPIQQYLEQYIKIPNLIEIAMPTRLSVIKTEAQDLLKKQKINLKYDNSLFMDILRGCAQPFSNEIDDLKFAFLMNRAVLYEDKILQIGCITKLQDGDLCIQLHIRNKSDQGLTITKINLIAPSNNQLNKLNVQDDSVLQKRSTFKISLKFQYQEFMKQPILEFSANNHEYHILLPVSLIKFAVSEIQDIVSLKEKWNDNKNIKVVIKSFIESPNPKFISQLTDFKRYFQTLVENENFLIMHLKIDQSDFGIKIKVKQQQLMLKVQSSQLLKIKGEQIIQQLLFLFNT